ncbi:hypothetical protein [Colwellia psychrerythraea]|uniref:Uncharacterized protein n=1 Tax=Colwellia psychrerythraea TaxID=28229 RepID=A0A099KHT8_COLPS|nr:hypothetical protein [Colwellia psychrerythraea]KGJ89138.1 hypothetical protein GAB14E_4134 [Colwellia psychrerythraea]
MANQGDFNYVLSKVLKKETSVKFKLKNCVNRWLRNITKTYDRIDTFNGNHNVLFFESFNQTDNDIFYKYVKDNTDYKICKLGASNKLSNNTQCTYLEFKAKWKEVEKTIFIYTPDTDVEPANFNVNTSVLTLDYELPLTIFALLKNSENIISYIKMDDYAISSCFADMNSREGKVKIVNDITTIITEYIKSSKNDTSLENISRYFPFYSIPMKIKKEALKKLILRHQKEKVV